MDKRPVVSICCLTYNHESFIRQCINGFLMQEVNFKYEIIVHDDASIDATQEILKQYAKQYPSIFKLILQNENQYSKGIDVIPLLLSQATGAYIALCEGDDYWTDPLKLQKQVDFLEREHRYVMCSHVCDYLYNDTAKIINNIVESDKIYTIRELVNGEWYFQTLSLVFRREAINLYTLSKYHTCVDAVLVFELLRYGGFGMRLKESMGVYRYHNGGDWSQINMNLRRQQEFKVRFDIYRVAPSIDSASMILGLWKTPISRKWLIYNNSIIWDSFIVLYRHWGFCFTMKLFFRKIFLGKSK